MSTTNDSSPVSDSGEQTIMRLAEAMLTRGKPGEQARAAAAVDALFRAEQGRVYAICLKFLGHAEWAHDAAQDVMLIAYSKLPEFRGQSSFRSWIYGIARFRCYDLRRKKREALSDDGFNEIVDEDPSALSQLRRRERMLLMREAAAAVLDATEQRAVHLRYVEQVSQDEIARLLNLESASGGRGLLQRCRRKLNREIRRRLEEMGHGSSFVRSTV